MQCCLGFSSTNWVTSTCFSGHCWQLHFYYLWIMKKCRCMLQERKSQQGYFWNMKKALDVNTLTFLTGSAEFSQHRDACVHMSEEHMIRVCRLVEAPGTRGLLERKAVATQRSFQLPNWKNPPQEHRQWQCHLSVFCRADLSWEQKKTGTWRWAFTSLLHGGWMQTARCYL